MSSKKGTLVHYIGQGLYTPELFASEAKTYGVSRGMPINTAMGLEYGSKILLAQDLGSGNANLFGGFTVTGFTPLNISKEERQKLYDILKVKDDESEDNQEGVKVKRLCGSYIILGKVDVRPDINNLKDCLKVLRGIKPDVKLLINGVYFDIEPVKYYPICFSRTITTADDLDFSTIKVRGDIADKAQIVNVKDYQKNN